MIGPSSSASCAAIRSVTSEKIGLSHHSDVEARSLEAR
jgi:hypothetical protein